MANYICKTVGPDSYAIRHKRKKIGVIFKVPGSDIFTGRLTATAKDGKSVEINRTGDCYRMVFDELAMGANRVSLCGEDNAGLASAAMSKSNAEIRAKVEKANAELGYRAYRTRGRGILI